MTRPMPGRTSSPATMQHSTILQVAKRRGRRRLRTHALEVSIGLTQGLLARSPASREAMLHKLPHPLQRRGHRLLKTSHVRQGDEMHLDLHFRSLLPPAADTTGGNPYPQPCCTTPKLPCLHPQAKRDAKSGLLNSLALLLERENRLDMTASLPALHPELPPRPLPGDLPLRHLIQIFQHHHHHPPRPESRTRSDTRPGALLLRAHLLRLRIRANPLKRLTASVPSRRRDYPSAQ